LGPAVARRWPGAASPRRIGWPTGHVLWLGRPRCRDCILFRLARVSGRPPRVASLRAFGRRTFPAEPFLFRLLGIVSMCYANGVPVSKEHRRLYRGPFLPLARACKERCGWRCQSCGVPHMALVQRLKANRAVWVMVGLNSQPTGLLDRPIRVVLSAAHLDGDRMNNSPVNLGALCQRCHRVLDSRRVRGGGWVGRVGGFSDRGLSRR